MKECEIAEKTPTFKKLNEPLEYAATILDAMASSGEPSFEQLRELSKVAVVDSPDDSKEETLMSLNKGIDALEHLSVAMPCLKEKLLYAATMLVVGALRICALPAGDRLAQEKKRIKSILIHNGSKYSAVERAKAIATKLWQADTEQDIRIGDMAEQVYRALAAEGFAESLPGTAERIKEWIKPVAPDYARKGGRRRKTP